MRERFLRKIFVIVMVIAFGSRFAMKELAHLSPRAITGAGIPQSSDAPVLTQKRLQHILYGDGTGGGHLHGQNAPCKSEFPAGWSAEDIAAVITKDAANDALPWRAEGNGNYTAVANENGVKILIVLSADRTRIITAYPVNTPRNPCPAHANDNSP